MLQLSVVLGPRSPRSKNGLSGTRCMRIAIVMPQLGLTMVEGTVSGWLKKPRDTVEKNEPLLNVSTDKVEMEVEAEVEGTLSEIIVSIGETVPVGAVLAYIESTVDD